MRRFIPVLVVCACVAVRPAAAQSTPPLTDVPLEQLLRFEVENVFGASERLQPVTEAPSSVTIITADEIARFGYRNLADILRSVRGFYVTDDRNYSYVGVRGFARAGDYNTRVLLLLNGHRINDSVYDQAPIGNELGLDPDVLDRVEVIRGPASSLYGTNAFFAVVNLVTRNGRSLKNTRVDMTAGSLGTALLRASTGGELSNGVTFGLSGTVTRSTGVKRLYFPSFDAPETNGGMATDLDGEGLGAAFGTIDVKDLNITAMYGRRTKDIPTASYGTIFNFHEPAEWTRDERVIVGATFTHPFGATRLDARSTFNRYSYYGEYPLPSVGLDAAPLLNLDAGLGVRWSLDVRATRPVGGAHTVTFGTEVLNNLRQNQSSDYDDPTVEPLLANHSSTQVALYAQDEIRPRPWLIANLGGRLDRYDAFTRGTPRAALILVPSPNQSFKYVYGRAFRAPNAYELYYYRNQLSSPSPESIATHEIAWEQYVSSVLRTSISAYAYRASQLITLVEVEDAVDVFPLAFRNAAVNRAKGVEFEAEVRTRTGLQVTGSYGLQRAIDDQRVRLTNSPQHLAKFRISVPGPGGSSAAFEAQYVSARATLSGTNVSAATVANASVRKRMSRTVELFGLVANLFDTIYSDPASDEHAFDAIEQNGRTARIGLRWMPWGR